jgi:hypothetical protein
MFTVDQYVGRLLEIQLAPPVPLEEAGAFAARIGELLAKAPGAVVCCSDFRQMDLLPSGIALRLLDLLKSSNPKIERHGFWLLGRGKFTSQADTLIREAGHPGRRIFEARPALEAWVGEALDGDERARLAQFLDERARDD